MPVSVSMSAPQVTLPWASVVSLPLFPYILQLLELRVNPPLDTMPPENVEEAVVEDTLKRLVKRPAVKVEVAVEDDICNAPLKVEVPIPPAFNISVMVVDPVDAIRSRVVVAAASPFMVPRSKLP